MKKIVIAALALAVVIAGCKKDNKAAAKGTNDTTNATEQAAKPAK